MSKVRLIFWMVLFVLITMVFTASAQTVTIKALMEDHPSTDALQYLKGEFENETGIKVILEKIPWGSASEKIHMLGISKSPSYDIYFDNYRAKGCAWSAAGYLEPLDEYINRPADKNPSLDMNDFPKAFLDYTKDKNVIWGLPLYGEGSFLMYRKDLFSEKGIDVPKTMNELMETAKKLTNGDIYGITARGLRGPHLYSNWRTFFFNFGGEYFDKDWHPTLNTKEGVEGTQFFVDLLKYAPPGVNSYGWQESHMAFNMGKAAMNIDATVNAGLLEDPATSELIGKVGYAPVPRVPGRPYRGGNVVAHSLFLSAFSEHKEEAWKFITWATSAEVQEKMLSTSFGHIGLTSKKAMDSQKFKEKYGDVSNGLIEALETGNSAPTPMIPEAAEFIDIVSLAVSEVLAGNKIAQEAMDQANEKVEEMMKKAGYYD